MNHTLSTGFTPVPDVIVDELGRAAGVVFGVVWRYCQTSDENVCYAKMDTIAKRAGIKKRWTRHQLRLLEAGGWVRREERRGCPSRYRDTKKWSIWSAKT